MKILNIDAYAVPKRALHMGGVDYPVVEQSVQSFIDNMKLAEDIEKNGQLTPREQVEQAVEMIALSIPSLPKDAIKRLSIDQLTMVLDFIRGDLDEKIGKGADAEGAGEQPAGSKS